MQAGATAEVSLIDGPAPGLTHTCLFALISAAGVGLPPACRPALLWAAQARSPISVDSSGHITLPSVRVAWPRAAAGTLRTHLCGCQHDTHARRGTRHACCVAGQPAATPPQLPEAAMHVSAPVRPTRCGLKQAHATTRLFSPASSRPTRPRPGGARR
jgi:hypothetical protein